MHAKLQDLRLLYLAHEVEKMFEGLEKAFHRHLPPPLRDELQPLFQGGPGHRELEMQFAQLNAEVKAREADIPLQELLVALRDCESLARRFYLDHSKELSDPALAQLFQRLAAEEAKHLAAVEQAITVARGVDYANGAARDA